MGPAVIISSKKLLKNFSSNAAVNYYMVVCSRKRVSTNQRVDNYEDEDDWTDVETRCSTAIEGHAK